eukprot:1267008-Rhodomonas_salina.3
MSRARSAPEIVQRVHRERGIRTILEHSALAQKAAPMLAPLFSTQRTLCKMWRLLSAAQQCGR